MNVYRIQFIVKLLFKKELKLGLLIDRNILNRLKNIFETIVNLINQKQKSVYKGQI